MTQRVGGWLKSGMGVTSSPIPLLIIEALHWAQEASEHSIVSPFTRTPSRRALVRQDCSAWLVYKYFRGRSLRSGVCSTFLGKQFHPDATTTLLSVSIIKAPTFVLASLDIDCAIHKCCRKYSFHRSDRLFQLIVQQLSFQLSPNTSLVAGILNRRFPAPLLYY